jgi:hypothetical protein
VEILQAKATALQRTEYAGGRQEEVEPETGTSKTHTK